MGKGVLKTLVLGLGNPILCDDSAGYQVAMSLKEKLDMPGVDIKEAGLAGLDFLDLITGYDRVIVIDAIQTEKGKPGNIYRFGPDSLTLTRHSSTTHNINIATAIELGKKLKLKLPKEITIFAIEVEDVSTFTEECTPVVKKAVPHCVTMVMRELQNT
jgi:hydrogenase maturation protease